MVPGDSDAMRCRLARFRTGMIPGTIGTPMPSARTLSTKLQYLSLSKNSWVIKNSAPASTLRLRLWTSASRLGAS